MNNTVIILGAGTSADYGYPLWESLKNQMIGFDVRDQLSITVGLDEDELQLHEVAHQEFITILDNNPDFTLDQIVYQMDRPKERHLNPIGHRVINIAGYLLSLVELENRRDGWITEFQSVLVDYVANKSGDFGSTTNLLDNLVVVSLNYDRAFNHFVSDDFFPRLVAHASYQPPSLRFSIELSKSNRLKLIKPHGFLVGLTDKDRKRNAGRSDNAGMRNDLLLENSESKSFRYPGNTTTLPYASDKITKQNVFLRMGKYMYMVDEMGQSDYSSANTAIRDADTVYCLGLSDKGLCQSHFDFQKDQAVYLSNKLTDTTVIESCKSGPKYLRLSKDEKRLNIADFPKIFENHLDAAR